jgi:UDP-N-acetyl-D-galactosamine dehydrogenase
METNIESCSVAVIGLGYVGLPLAFEFSKHFDVCGFDINEDRILNLRNGYDSTKNYNELDLSSTDRLHLTYEIKDLKQCNVFIITVPTPVDESNNPDFTPLIKASELVGQILKQDDTVIFESTVFPGATREICIPILQEASGLVLNKGFWVGYSPERINPGDKDHTLTEIVKVTSGSDKSAAKFVDSLYRKVISVGTHKVDSIEIAEAAKIIENIQRDINIALINEFSIIFNKLNLDTEKVLQAAETKWNFLSFRPGLVGGHCIGVDPYYLTYKARQLGIHALITDAGRKLNDEMAEILAQRFTKELAKRQLLNSKSKILIMGASFKKNCGDLRNSQVIKLFKTLNEYCLDLSVYDPLVSTSDWEAQTNSIMEDNIYDKMFDAIIYANDHDIFNINSLEDLSMLLKPENLIFDLTYKLKSYANVIKI